MKKQVSQSEDTRVRSSEERRFILRSIARANAKKQPGPYLNKPLSNNPTAPLDKRGAQSKRRSSRLRKGPQTLRSQLLVRTAIIGRTAGAMIGFNIGLLAMFSATSFLIQLTITSLLTLLGAIVGTSLAWALVLLKRTDLFRSNYPLCHLCQWHKK